MSSFSTASPLRAVTFDSRGDKQSRTLRRPYFGQHRTRDRDTVEFQLPYGKSIDLFRANGLSVERLVEVQPDPVRRAPTLVETIGRGPDAGRWRRSANQEGRSSVSTPTPAVADAAARSTRLIARILVARAERPETY